jgi:hypothetical protein
MVTSSVIQFNQLIPIYIGNSDGQFSCTSKPSLGTTNVVTPTETIGSLEPMIVLLDV